MGTYKEVLGKTQFPFTFFPRKHSLSKTIATLGHADVLGAAPPLSERMTLGGIDRCRKVCSMPFYSSLCVLVLF